ncbi:hypothetical protein [Puniceicoccus vermicola]|uniref:Uncharacterized protein n=1 Tax=Puniceicoccus vermicola TaxID=388746 RepID=A0A7X1AWS1_9BACT|nr:hypothetical protein [Puniceicoccus vermicola]MBC2600478.1 hypothetical protein [Puniceicoccus vermicola]
MKKLLLITLFLMPFLASAEDAREQWKGFYKGIYSLVTPNGEKTIPRPFSMVLDDTMPGGYIRLTFAEAFSEGYREQVEILEVTIANLNQRKDHSPPTITEERFYLPAVFVNPTEFEANVIKGGFDGEKLISGTIVTYKLSLDEAPKEDMRIIFKAGRAP